MRTKLFLAFIFIILFALISNIVFERLVIRDFEDFLKGTEEDHIYWVMASVEGSYSDHNWDNVLLREALHWGLMLGFESYLQDMDGRYILSSDDIIASMNQNMRKRMDSLLELRSSVGEFVWYPLYVGGEEIGKLHLRSIDKYGTLYLKEEVFKKRGKGFLLISFLIAGGGALVLSLLFTIFLSRPIRRLTVAAGKIAKGDFAVHGPRRKILKDEIDKLTESFNYMAEALKREDLLRKHLTSNIAHELRTPLTIIRGNLEAIEDGVISEPVKALNNMHSEVLRLTSLVEGIEDITSAEASFFRKGTLEDINLREFVENITGGMKKIIEQKGLYLKTEGPLINISTYPEKLHIILKNLLTNSMKFSSSGGITVSWGTIDLEVESGFFITVKDKGRGISPESLPKIFDRFYKSNDSSGKGLGLSIVKELVEVLGGAVNLDSDPGSGTTFTIKLPDEAE